MESIIPEIDTVSEWASWGNRRDILYKCPKCHASFRILGKQERFCHNCGQKIDWQFVPDFIDSTNIENFKEMTIDDIKKMVEDYIVNMHQFEINKIEGE